MAGMVREPVVTTLEMTLPLVEANRALADAIADELAMEPGKAMGALVYLVENGVLETYEEERFGVKMAGLRFKEAEPPELTV